MENKDLLVLSELGTGNSNVEVLATADRWRVEKGDIIVHDGVAYAVEYIVGKNNDDAWEVIQMFFQPPFQVADDEIFNKKWVIANVEPNV